MSKKVKALLLAIVLIAISFSFIVINGKTYVVKKSNLYGATSIEDLNIIIEDESIARIKDKEIVDGTLIITFESISKGKTFYRVNYGEDSICMDSIYVHNFGVITINSYLGTCNGVLIIPISSIIWLIYVLFLLIAAYKQSLKENIYQYKNIAYLGLIIFLIVTLFIQLMSLPNYSGLIDTVYKIKNMSSFAILLLPIAFVVSILVIISNISLIRKEGLNIRNVLGVVLGVFLCFATMLPDLLYQALYSASWIDIHNQNGAGVYIYDFVESLIYISVTYVECVLIGTIIMGFKAAKHTPSFDKDAIIILGCQIKKDGSLTKLLKNRVDRAIEFGKMQEEKSNKDILFVPSGGKGSDEVTSEADAMKNYLQEQGIEKDKILVENQAKNTFENIKFSNKLIHEKIKDAKIAFSTTNYHVFRAGIIATEQSLNFEGIGAKTKSYFWINAFIREFIATLVAEKKKHLAVILFIIMNSFLMILITYFNNNAI